MHYVHTDHLGSLNVITNESGAIEQELSFDAWGNRRDPNNWQNLTSVPTNLITDRGFTGHEHLDGFKLINMNGRFYDPMVGRFLSADPFVQSPGNTQSYNRYSYCVNNPLMFTDPSGYSHSTPIDYYENLNQRLEDRANFGAGLFNYNGGYKYSSGGGYTYNGQPVSFDVVYNNYLLPTSTVYSISTANYIITSINELGGITFNDKKTDRDFYLAISNNGSYFSSYDGGSLPFAVNASSGGGWLKAADHINNGIGGFGAGMTYIGGNFRLNNSHGFSPKFYTKPNATGKIFNGGFGIRTYNTTNWGRGIGYGSLGLSFVIGGINVTNAWQQDGHTYGSNTQMAVATTSLSISGAWAGAEIGASIGIWFGPIGGIVGGVIGGVVGGIAGSKVGETIVDKTRF